MNKAKAGGIASLVVVLAAAPLVIRHEGVVQRPYADPVGIRTACVGETDREVTHFRSAFTRDECVAIMGASLYAHAQELDKCIYVPVTTGQAVALLSWSYNVGVGAACKSTLVRKLNAGRPAQEWCRELHKWNRAGGRVLPGLVKRRADEYAECVK